MEQLVITYKNNVVTSSRRVADKFGKEHKNVLQAIENLVAENSAAKYFIKTSYINICNRKRTELAYELI